MLILTHVTTLKMGSKVTNKGKTAIMVANCIVANFNFFLAQYNFKRPTAALSLPPLGLLTCLTLCEMDGSYIMIWIFRVYDVYEVNNIMYITIYYIFSKTDEKIIYTK